MSGFATILNRPANLPARALPAVSSCAVPLRHVPARPVTQSWSSLLSCLLGTRLTPGTFLPSLKSSGCCLSATPTTALVPPLARQPQAATSRPLRSSLRRLTPGSLRTLSQLFKPTHVDAISLAARSPLLLRAYSKQRCSRAGRGHLRRCHCVWKAPGQRQQRWCARQGVWHAAGQRQR